MSNPSEAARRSGRTRRLGAGIVVAGLLSSTGVAQLDEEVAIYGTRHAPEQLWKVDVNTGKATLATTLSATMVAAAMHPHTGEIYVVDNGGVNPMYRWNPQTGVETLVTPGESKQYHRFGFDACGRLFGVQLNTRTLLEVDPDTGLSTPVGAISNTGTAGATGDLAFAPGDKYGFYYGIGMSLYYVPFSDLTAIPLMGVDFQIDGLAFQPNGRLYATDKFTLYELHPDTATYTTVGAHGVGKLNDLSSGNWPVVLWPDKPSYSAGDPITLTTFKSEPGGPAGLAVTSVDGSPFFLFLRYGSFDPTGEWEISSTVPTGLAGLELGLRVFGNLPGSSELVASPQARVQFD